MDTFTTNVSQIENRIQNYQTLGSNFQSSQSEDTKKLHPPRDHDHLNQNHQIQTRHGD